MTAKSRSSAQADDKALWQPPSAEDWSRMLRSAVLARDLLHWSDDELRASGICSDYPTVQHLADVFDSAMDELERVEGVLLEAQRRLLVVATETRPG